jgi:hypothetical protein
MLLRLAALGIASAMLAGCSVFGVRSDLEMPDYDVVAKLGEDLEVRRYGARVAAEATVTADSYSGGQRRAFGLLFDYIKGANKGSRDVAMTAPVETDSRGAEIAMTAPVETGAAEKAEGGKTRVTMRFLLPAKFTPETAPVPTHPDLRLTTLQPETMAVLRFSGFGGRESVRNKRAELKQRLAKTAWHPKGDMISMFYDPPWTLPFFRRNEVAVRVRKAAS